MRARYALLVVLAACNLSYPADVAVDANRDAAAGDSGFADAAPGTIAVHVANARSFVRQGGSVSIPITLSRGAGVDSDVTITVTSPPLSVQFDALTIPTGQSSGQLVAHADAAAPYARATSTVHAAAGTAASMDTLEIDVIGNPGAVDTTFGPNGTVEVGASNATPVAIFAQSDRVVAVQIARPSASGVQLTRLLRDGSADSTFGTSGVYYDELSSTTLTNFTTLAATTRPDGRFFLAGSGSNAGTESPFVVGVTADGLADTNTPPVDLAIADVRVRAVLAFDTDWVIAGWKGSNPAVADAYLKGSKDSVLPETIYSSSGFQEFKALLSQTQGRIVAVDGDASTTLQFAVRRYDNTGTEDTSFQQSFPEPTMKPYVLGVAPDPHGFVAWGSGGGPLATGVHTVMAMWRSQDTGASDTTFGPTSKGVYESPATTRGQIAVAVVPNPTDGGYFLIGYDVDVSTSVGNDYVLEMVKLDPNGLPDTALGTQGVIRDTAITLQPIAAATRTDHRVAVLGIEDFGGVKKLVVRAYFY
ncbi:MAG TPA: hypothetical protein VL463_15325 [Kofleriaceae bacterium]|nr:hypothetical protein [Kofleriaceae bacterium]